MIRLHHNAVHLCNRAAVEKAYEATFVLQSQYVGSSGTLSTQPADIFYVAEPNREKGHDNYFGIIPDYDFGERVYIVAVKPELVVRGILIEDVFAYSAYGHDFVTHPCVPEAFMDGGRHYSRGSPEYPENAFVYLEPTGPVMMVYEGDSWWKANTEVKWGTA